MRTTNLLPYLAHPPEPDLTVQKRVFFKCADSLALEALAQKAPDLQAVHRLPLSGLVVVEGTVQALSRIAAEPGVSTAEEDVQLFLCSEQINDALGVTTFKGSLLQPDGSGITVGLLDTGIDAAHPDLWGSVVSSKDFTKVGNNAPLKANAHGTSIAGVIGGRGDPAKGGFRGIAEGVKFLDARVFDPAGRAFTSDILEALAWLAAQAPTLLLFGGVTARPTSGETLLAATCRQLLAAGCVLLAPAGNFGPEAGTIGSPGDVPGVLAIGAVTSQGEPAFFSSRGSLAGTSWKPDFVMPGTNIPSLKITSPEGVESVATLTGTCAAAAYVAGLAALVLQHAPDKTPTTLLFNLAKAAENVGAVPATQGRGIINGIALAEHYRLLHPSPLPLKKITRMALLLSSLLTAAVILAFALGIYLW